jgi:lipid-A-disaccharide synthase-like uncharacterized protein
VTGFSVNRRPAGCYNSPSNPSRTLIVEHILHALANYQITPWKAVGYLGMVMFTSRWFVQVYATRKHKRVVMPLSFWVLSVFGSILLLAYFVVGKNDSVGILSNLFPVVVSVYNLVMHLRHHKNTTTGDLAA